MNMRLSALIIALLLSPQMTQACSFGLGPYEPDLTARRSSNVDIPRPVLTDAELVRGKGSAGSSCEDAGVLSMTVSFPEGFDHDIGEFGLALEVVAGTDPYGVFEGDYQLFNNGDRASTRFVVAWLDGAPNEHLPLKVTVEVRYVYGTQMGPPARFRIE